MGLDNENAARVVFDIETFALPDAADHMERPEAPANYKDPVKIESYIENRRIELLDKAALDVDLGRVVAIGALMEWQDTPKVWDCPTIEDERFVLEQFWKYVEGRQLIGFNCVAFDLPMLLRRSVYLGVPTPALEVERYRHRGVTDLLQVLTHNGLLTMRGLGFYLKRFGIAVEDSMTGAGIGRAVIEGRWDDIQNHVRCDVLGTSQLATRLGYFAKERTSTALNSPF